MTATIYTKKLLNEAWRHKRQEIVRRDNGKCRNCGSSLNLEVHHRQYHINIKTGLKRDPWDYENSYLITLCKTCHAIGHKQYNISIFKN